MTWSLLGCAEVVHGRGHLRTFAEDTCFLRGAVFLRV